MAPSEPNTHVQVVKCLDLLRQFEPEAHEGFATWIGIIFGHQGSMFLMHLYGREPRTLQETLSYMIYMLAGTNSGQRPPLPCESCWRFTLVDVSVTAEKVLKGASSREDIEVNILSLWMQFWTGSAECRHTPRQAHPESSFTLDCAFGALRFLYSLPVWLYGVTVEHAGTPRGRTSPRPTPRSSGSRSGLPTSTPATRTPRSSSEPGCRVRYNRI